MTVCELSRWTPPQAMTTRGEDDEHSRGQQSHGGAPPNSRRPSAASHPGAREHTPICVVMAQQRPGATGRRYAASGVCSAGTISSRGGGGGGVPSPKGRPPSASRPWAVSQLLKVGARRDDAGRVDVALHHVVVPLDVVEVDSISEARRLEEVARVRPQHRHLAELLAVALEVAVVHGVEAHQGDEEAHVGLGDGVAHQEALASRDAPRASRAGGTAARTPSRTRPGCRRSRSGTRRC